MGLDLTRLRPMPEALAAAIRGDKRPVATRQEPMRARLARLSSNAAAVSGDYGDVALHRELAELRAAQPGTRNHALNKAAYALYQLADAGVLDRANMEAALIAVGMGLGLGDFEVVQTLRSAEEGAAKNPRGAGRLPSVRETGQVSAVSDVPSTEPVPEEPLHYPTLRSRLLTTPEMLSRPPPEPLLGDILFKNTLAALYGHPGSMKSFLALDWCLSLAKDYEWFHRPMAHGARCLYVAAEGVAGIGPRVRAWIHGHSGIFDESFPNMEWYPEAIDLLDPLWVDALAWHASLTLPSLVVVDTLSRSIPGGDENNAIDMTEVIASLDRVRLSSGATILVVHHSPKIGGGLRGHSSLHGACDSEIEVSRDESHLLVKCAKQKDAEAFSDINLWWKPVEGYPSIVLTDIPQDVDDGKIRRDAETVWAKLRGHYAHTGATKALLVEATGLTEREVMEAVNCLFDQNRIQKEGTGFRARG